MTATFTEMAPGATSYASALVPAYYRLGTVLDHKMTANEALEAAHLANWDVRKTPLTTDTGNGTLVIPDRYATIFTNPVTQENQYLGVVGSHYRPIQNEAHADLLDAIVGESGAHFETAGSWSNGRKTFMAMRLPEDMLVGGQDAVGQYLIATNDHSGNGSFRFLISPIRIACANQLAAVIRGAAASFSIRHTAAASGRIQEAREALGLTWKYLEAFQMEADMMLDATMTDRQFNEMVAKFYEPSTDSTRALTASERNIAGVTSLWTGNSPTMAGVKGTHWGAYQAITEYVDHHQDVRGGDDSARARRAISQEGLEVKSAAFNLLKVGA